MKRNKLIAILIFLTLLIGMTTFSYIPIALFNIDINRLNDSLKILYEFCCNIGFMVVIYLLFQKQINDDLKDYLKNFKKYFKLSISYYIIGLIIMMVSNNIISIFFNEAIASNEEAVRSLIDLYPVYMLFSVSIYAPFVEEIIFRKSIKDIFLTYDDNKITKYMYIITSGFIFAMLHIIGNVTSNLDYLYIIPYLSLGIAFAIIYNKTNNIFTTISMHSLHNLIAIILYLVVNIK